MGVGWPPWLSRWVGVEVRVERVEGLGCAGKVSAAVEVRWKGPMARGLPGFLRRGEAGATRRLTSATAAVLEGGVAVFGDEFRSACGLSWVGQISLLLGTYEEGEEKRLPVVGTTMLRIGELASELQSREEAGHELQKAISLHVNDSSINDALLYVTVDFLELGTLQEEPTAVQKSSFLKRVRNYMLPSRRAKKNKRKARDETEASDRSGHSLIASTSNSMDDLADEASTYSNSTNSLCSKEEVGQVHNRSLSVPVSSILSWGKRKRKQQPLPQTKHQTDIEVDSKNAEEEASNQEEPDVGRWKENELVSRDGQVKLKTQAFFASIDQRSDAAGGEGACAVLATVVSDWLHSNPGRTPTKPELDVLIIQGSSDWRKLCTDQTNLRRFPDKHFDLETVLEASIRPVCVSLDKSLVGFFNPERFECLDGAMSFDAIWSNMSSMEGEERVYIVGWNDHFFVLKTDSHAYYVIDTLGERLFDGCKKAYMLRFDACSRMEMVGGEGVVCAGRDCCKEFIKRFLAAIPVREVEAAAKKCTSVVGILHHKLQIELHLSEASSSASSLSASPLSSPSDGCDLRRL